MAGLQREHEELASVVVGGGGGSAVLAALAASSDTVCLSLAPVSECVSASATLLLHWPLIFIARASTLASFQLTLTVL